MVVAVGDLVCGPDDEETSQRCRHEDTYDLVDGRDPDLVLALGDTQYPSGEEEDFEDLYEDTWGRLKSKTRPAPGNHEYHIDGAAGYFSYFGELAGPDGRGYYSFDAGAWHMISLNSEIEMDDDSQQYAWLEEDLAQNVHECVLAYWHRPLFASGGHGGAEAVRPLWELLYEHDADVVLNGHNHNYERFAAQTPSGEFDESGIVEFVVGSGGKSLYEIPEDPEPNSEAQEDETFGVLEMRLSPAGYDWQFLAVDGEDIDSGSAECH
jgi:acid phosphatase type 7